MIVCVISSCTNHIDESGVIVNKFSTQEHIDTVYNPVIHSNEVRYHEHKNVLVITNMKTRTTIHKNVDDETYENYNIGDSIYG